VSVNVLLEVLRTPAHARWILYAVILLGLVAKLRPWKALVAVLAGTATFGIVVHAIVAAAWPRGVHGLVSISGTDFSHGRWPGWALRHWLVLPADAYEARRYTILTSAFDLLLR